MSPRRKFTNTTLARNLRAIRAYKGLQAKEVTSKIGIHLNTLYFWERGYTTPSVRTLEKVARVYGVSATQLLHPTLSLSTLGDTNEQ